MSDLCQLLNGDLGTNVLNANLDTLIAQPEEFYVELTENSVLQVLSVLLSMYEGDEIGGATRSIRFLGRLFETQAFESEVVITDIQHTIFRRLKARGMDARLIPSSLWCLANSCFVILPADYLLEYLFKHFFNQKSQNTVSLLRILTLHPNSYVFFQDDEPVLKDLCIKCLESKTIKIAVNACAFFTHVCELPEFEVIFTKIVVADIIHKCLSSKRPLKVVYSMLHLANAWEVVVTEEEKRSLLQWPGPSIFHERIALMLAD
ncbi:hypothetical protein PCE1_004676 [Barthelona sp. PCE]